MVNEILLIIFYVYVLIKNKKITICDQWLYCYVYEQLLLMMPNI